MNDERYESLIKDIGELTLEELKEGWHFCPEFDGLLTQGELFKQDGITCICGFNKDSIE